MWMRYKSQGSRTWEAHPINVNQHEGAVWNKDDLLALSGGVGITTGARLHLDGRLDRRAEQGKAYGSSGAQNRSIWPGR